ncbi:EPIDERMAL PATTERNING FACTOR-like protein [Wolffia australiana]
MIICRWSAFLLCLLLLLRCSEARIITQGRERVPGVSLKSKGDEGMMVKIRVGSRPPHCERMCQGCGHCDPVQVPAVPMARVGGLSFRRDDGSSNYKPVSWKCKCGDLILNP